MKSVEIIFLLQSSKNIPDVDFEALSEAINKEKEVHRQSDDQSALFNCWLAITALEIIKGYKEAFVLLKSRKYKAGWDLLEKIEINLENIEFNDIKLNKYPALGKISETISKYQELFPYRVFASPEILNKKVECTICGGDMNPFGSCKHIPGRVYNGELCVTQVKEAEFISISMVANPVQKFSAVYDDIENPEKYKLLEYLMPVLEDEQTPWDFEIITKYHPHSTIKVGRNEKCPCLSGKKFKHCCRNNSEGIKYPHYEFILPDHIVKQKQEMLNRPTI